jgi:hypothetical protein
VVKVTQEDRDFAVMERDYDALEKQLKFRVDLRDRLPPAQYIKLRNSMRRHMLLSEAVLADFHTTSAASATTERRINIGGSDGEQLTIVSDEVREAPEAKLNGILLRKVWAQLVAIAAGGMGKWDAQPGGKTYEGSTCGKVMKNGVTELWIVHWNELMKLWLLVVEVSSMYQPREVKLFLGTSYKRVNERSTQGGVNLSTGFALQVDAAHESVMGLHTPAAQAPATAVAAMAKSPFKKPAGQQSTSPRAAVCRDFNADYGCRRGSACFWAHECRKCKSRSHGAHECGPSESSRKRERSRSRDRPDRRSRDQADRRR